MSNSLLVNLILSYILHFKTLLNPFTIIIVSSITFLLTMCYYKIKKKIVWLRYYEPYIDKEVLKMIDEYENKLIKLNDEIDDKNQLIDFLKSKMKNAYQAQISTLNILTFIDINKKIKLYRKGSKNNE